MLILHTERLTLRTVEADDAPFYLALLNEPTYIAHISDRGIRTLGAAREAIEQGPRLMQRRLGFSLYLIERRADAAPLGICGLIKRDTLADVDIGYAVMQRYAGQGYAHEAAAAVLAHGRDSLGLPRLLGVTGPDNAGSNRLLQKLGLRLEKTLQFKPDGPASNLYRIDFQP